MEVQRTGHWLKKKREPRIEREERSVSETNEKDNYWLWSPIFILITEVAPFSFPLLPHIGSGRSSHSNLGGCQYLLSPLGKLCS